MRGNKGPETGKRGCLLAAKLGRGRQDRQGSFDESSVLRAKTCFCFNEAHGHREESLGGITNVHLCTCLTGIEMTDNVDPEKQKAKSGGVWSQAFGEDMNFLMPIMVAGKHSVSW